MTLTITNLIPATFIFLSNLIIITAPLLRKISIKFVVNLILILALILTINQKNIDLTPLGSFFIFNNYTNIIQIIIIISSISYILITPNENKYIYGKNGSNTLYILILYSIISLLILINSYDFLTIYLTIEFHSIASYILAAYKKDSKLSTEAGLKYLTIGALASGILLFGLSYIYGWGGISNVGDVYYYLINEKDINIGIILGLLLIIVAFLFN